MIELQYLYLYDKGIKNGSKIFILFPIFQMIIAFIFQLARVTSYTKNHRYLLTSAYLFMFIVNLIMSFNESWIWFVATSFCLGRLSRIKRYFQGQFDWNELY